MLGLWARWCTLIGLNRYLSAIMQDWLETVAINGFHELGTLFYRVHRVIIWGSHLLLQKLFFFLCNDFFEFKMDSETINRLVEALILSRHNVLFLFEFNRFGRINSHLLHSPLVEPHIYGFGEAFHNWLLRDCGPRSVALLFSLKYTFSWLG